MRILVSDQNFGDDAQLERRLAAEAGVELVVESCGSEQEVAAALERHRPAWYSEEAIVEFRRKAVESALALLRGERPTGVVAA